MNVMHTSVEDGNKTGPKACSCEKAFLCNIGIWHFTITIFPVYNLHGTFFLMVNSFNFVCMLACAADFGFTN